MTQKEFVEKTPAFGLTTRVNIPTGNDVWYEHLHSLMMKGCRFPGCLNAEITPRVFGGGSEWVVVHRFRTEDEVKAWYSSDERKQLLEKLPAEKNIYDEVSPHTAGGTVTVSIVSTVKSGKESEYYDWLHRIQTAQSKFPGYEGTYFQPPTSAERKETLVLLRFSNPESFDNWFNSKERAELLEQAQEVLHHDSIQRMTSAFPGWMPSDPVTKKQPANYKTAMLVLLGIQPVVLLQMKYLAPHLTLLPPHFETFFMNALGVSTVTWVCMPRFTKWFYKWLLPQGPNKRRIELLGVLLIITLYFLTSELFAHLP